MYDSDRVMNVSSAFRALEVNVSLKKNYMSQLTRNKPDTNTFSVRSASAHGLLSLGRTR